jgi:two-component system chemotaxis response regulator CheB
VIGTSAGGVDALRSIVATIPRDINAAIFVVLHIGTHRSDLPRLLASSGDVPAVHARDGDAIVPGLITVAPPDHHMILENGRVVLTRGPRENWARPAIDPLFRSAAHSYGRDVIGVLLTGGLNDGTAGLFAIKAALGTTIVQDPADCQAPNMPQSAIANVEIDYIVPLAAISELLVRLAGEMTNEVPAVKAPDPVTGDAQGRGATAQYTENPPAAVTCPDCGGALQRSELGTLTQFSCHIGHVYTAEIMLAAQFVAMERFVEQALRSLGERAELCRQMLARTDAASDARKSWHDALHEALDQREPLQAVLIRRWIHPGLAS